MVFTAHVIVFPLVLSCVSQTCKFCAVHQVAMKSQADRAVLTQLPKPQLQLLRCYAQSVDAGRLSCKITSLYTE